MMKIKIGITLLALFAGLVSSYSQAIKTPAFPGAEGYGKYVTGGRGGRVIYVTHLKDNTDKFGAGYAGSLRAALETSGTDPITIMFKCGGVISPMGTLMCSRSNVTLAGQTALGDGICIKGWGIKFSGQNIIVRYMRFRVGDDIQQNDPALSFSNGKNAIFDHCSFSWSVEENVNITDVDSVTLQWCINTESLYNSVHIKGQRAYAAQWGGEHASYHHNLLAHHNTRMPRQNGNTSNDHHLTWDYRNNVHYNWGTDGAFYGGGIEENGGWCHSNLINNYYKPGPATTTNKSNQFFCAPSGGRPAVVGTGNDYIFGYGLWWLEGNVMYNNPDKTSNNFSGLSGPVNHDATAAFDVAPVTTTTADVAYTEVLAKAGATKPKRDSIDARIVKEVKTGTATFGGEFGASLGIIDHNTDIKPAGADASWNAWGIYSTVSNANAPLDTDGDGIPDTWETAKGLNPNDASDGNTKNVDGYTNLELYLTSMTVDVNTSTPSIQSKNNTLRIYPNPAADNFFIENANDIVKVEVYDVTGKLISVIKYTFNNPVDVSSLSSGLYIIKLITKNGQAVVQKITKK